MFTPADIRNMNFDKGMRGYKSEDVDAFLEEIAAQLTAFETEKAELEEKMFMLAEKIEEYRENEQTLKTTLINAQRLGESVIKEAKVKADVIIRDASSKAERIMEAADARNDRETLVFTRMKSEIASFKNEVLQLYKEHIDLLSALPDDNQLQETAPHQEDMAQKSQETNDIVSVPTSADTSTEQEMQSNENP